MTKQEIIKKLDELDHQQFMLMMQDHWDRYDFDENNRFAREMAELRKMLAAEG